MGATYLGSPSPSRSPHLRAPTTLPLPLMAVAVIALLVVVAVRSNTTLPSSSSSSVAMMVRDGGYVPRLSLAISLPASACTHYPPPAAHGRSRGRLARGRRGRIPLDVGGQVETPRTQIWQCESFTTPSPKSGLWLNSLLKIHALIAHSTLVFLH
jgi:hypothetical protein